MKVKGIIARVKEGTLAEELELQPGDRILAVNGKAVKDIIELSFALADENLELLIEKQDGSQELFELEKDYDEDLGVEFESAVFDQIRQCANRCLFCFVDQMPPGMRQSLYIKDDDYRLSFLYGNFVTLTNLGPKDLERIQRLHLSPLYVSVHTTDGDLRARMLSNPRAKNIKRLLDTLIAGGIELHTQVVLCPGLNDEANLEHTISELYARHPGVRSLAIVPVGLTRYREDCYPLEGFTPAAASRVISAVGRWQERCKRENDTHFVYLADEFYLSAGEPIPHYERYDDFPQLENGIGLVRSFLAEWEEAKAAIRPRYHSPHKLDVVCGVSIAKVLTPLLAGLNTANLTIRIVPVENKFFGPKVTVTGLLTGKDIADALCALGGERVGVIIPGVALRKGEDVFLDNSTPRDIAAKLGVPVRVAYSAADLADLLANWR
ncbi:MAG TPA: DUF512 domain-containing protein [Selenomonadales bacterium]|nr:DUF512 domain-containing protein [Selenomonadales bacterium]